MLKKVMAAKLHNILNLKLIFLQLIAFSIPLAPRIIPVLILILLIIWLYENNFKQKWKDFKGETLFLLQPSLFLLYLLGLLWSNNMNHAVSDIETKLTLLFFPVIIFTIKIRKEQMQAIKDRFIEGCSLAIVLLFIFSSYNYYIFNDPSIFYYSSFTVHLHPSYFSLYLNFGIILVIDKIINNKLNIYWTSIYILGGLLFLISIFLSSSRSGMLSLIFTLGLGTILMISKKWSFIMLFSFILICASFFYLSKSAKVRFDELIDAFEAKTIEKSTTSSSLRLWVWKMAGDIVFKNSLFGVGTGDVKDELIKKYQLEGITGALNNKLNAHNQYFQTAIALGIPGLLILLSCLFLPFLWALKYKNWIFLIFLLLIGFNFLSESILERQAGVIFFAFFSSIFINTKNQNSNDTIFPAKN